MPEIVERCDECPMWGVEKARAGSPAGRLLEKVLDFDGIIQSLKVDWSEISAEVINGLQVLKDERSKYQVEQQKEDHERQVEQTRMEHMKQGMIARQPRRSISGV